MPRRPGAIVHAVYSGHRYARELDADRASLAYRRDAPLSRASESAATAASRLRMSVTLPPAVAGLEPTLPSSWYTLGAGVRTREGAHLLPRMALRRARGGARRTRAPSGCSTSSARASSWCATAKDSCVPSTTSAATAVRACAATTRRPPAQRAVLGGGIAGGRIICPYHQWTYDLDGRLIAAPLSHRRARLRQVALQPLPGGRGDAGAASSSCNLTPAEAAPLAAAARRHPRAHRAATRSSELRIGHTIRYEVAANWKVICENYNECYHCAGVHPELCAVVPAFRERGGANLDWARGIPHRQGAYTFTSSGTTARRAFPDAQRGRAGAPQGRARSTRTCS